MKVKYFPDTDTAHVEFKNNDVHETKEISENIYIDVDEKGNIVRARQKINCHFSRPDLGQICLIRNCKTTVIAGYFEDFAILNRTKMA